jgi:hypothetical protein
MQKLTGATVLAALLVATPVFAQMANEPGTITMNESGYQQKEILASGRITEIDLANGTVTLDNGLHFTLSPALQYTSFPALGQDVQVTYSEQNGQNVARIIEVGGTHSQDNNN